MDKRESKEDSRAEEDSLVDRRENFSGDGSEERTDNDRVLI